MAAKDERAPKALPATEEETPEGQQQELFLHEIESVDDYWGPTFRAIYEAEQHESFLERLEKAIEEHDLDIEKMCNYHYQGFISSVRDLLHVRTDATHLNTEVINIDKDLRASCAKVMERGDELVKARRVEKNVAATIESLSLCLPVLKMFNKLSKQMQEKRYHPALKTLEQLEHTYLPRIANYRYDLIRSMTRSACPRLQR